MRGPGPRVAAPRQRQRAAAPACRRATARECANEAGMSRGVCKAGGCHVTTPPNARRVAHPPFVCTLRRARAGCAGQRG